MVPPAPFFAALAERDIVFEETLDGHTLESPRVLAS
jgi:hypothetical protein